jgi:predicted ester cyclase
MTRERVRTSLAEAVVRALVAGDVLALQRMVSPDVLDHSAQPGQPAGWAGVRERAMTLCAAMPESEVSVDVLSASGDTVLARAELVALRRDHAAATTAPSRLTVALVLRFVDDLLVEMWTSADLVLDRPVTHVLPQQNAESAAEAAESHG